MPALLTKNFKILIAQQVYNLLELGENSYLPSVRRSYLYAFLGRHLQWNAGTEVAGTPLETDIELNSYYKRGILAKQLTIENAALVVPRKNWTSKVSGKRYNMQELSEIERASQGIADLLELSYALGEKAEGGGEAPKPDAGAEAFTAAAGAPETPAPAEEPAAPEEETPPAEA